jgi:apolipoprotein D and lipocalin family protein
MKEILITLTLVSFTFAQQSPPKTVDYVDLKKYVGLWYEIAKIPNRFQSQCVKGTTAKYTLNGNGEIDVINSCIDEDNETDDANGLARVVDKKTNAKLEVSFVSFFGWRPFWGDYWIIGLDENYQWAIVGTPNRKYGWILSRTPKLEAEILDKIFSILKEQGYNPKDFEMSKH